MRTLYRVAADRSTGSEFTPGGALSDRQSAHTARVGINRAPAAKRRDVDGSNHHLMFTGVTGGGVG